MKDISVAVTHVSCQVINFQVTVFLCFKYDVSPTRVSRFTFAPSMADPTNIDIQSAWSVPFGEKFTKNQERYGIPQPCKFCPNN